MARFGYTMMCEQSPPDALVRDIQSAEQAGFDFSVISDHYQPWLASQGHSPYAWAVLGAASQATERIPLISFVTCPTLRYHPAVVAQKAATIQILSRNRFRLGLGAGESLNEHTLSASAGPRSQSATKCSLRRSTSSPHCSTKKAPSTTTASTSKSTPRSCGTDPSSEYRSALPSQARTPAGSPAPWPTCWSPQSPSRSSWRCSTPPAAMASPASRQIALCYDADRDTAIERVNDQFRWFGLGWKVNADLPNPDSFQSATELLTPEQVAEQIACGPDLDEHVEKIKQFIDAGFEEIALVQIGGETQSAFLTWAANELLPALRDI